MPCRSNSIEESGPNVPTVVYVSRGLAEVLADLASDADPDRVTTGISVRAAGDLAGADHLDPETPVFTDFYLPDPGNSVFHVFGVDLSTPARSAQGRFVSHPLGNLSLTSRDDLAQVVIVAVPPWDLSTKCFAAFTRDGERTALEFVDADPPEERLE